MKPEQAAAARDAAARLAAWGEARAWAGSDPYDGLNARRLRVLQRSRRGRQVVTQLVKRSPVDLRPMLAIPRERSSAGLAHVISAYSTGGFLDDADAERRVRGAVDQLLGLRCTGIDEPCWGYHFDVQTRVFFYPRGAPNTIATAFAGLALLDAYESLRDRTYLAAAEGAADFFLRHVPQTPAADGNGAFFGYLIGDRTPIHNASMLVCALLSRVAAHSDRPELREAAAAGVAYTVNRQRADGSWPYGEQPHLDWVDNFHTGYVLECLMTCADNGVTGADEAAISRGLDLYANALFREDGAPKYTLGSLHPIDGQCVAQGIQTLALASGRRPELLSTAREILRYALSDMLRPDGAFVFQRRRYWSNSTPHVRWVQAPMLAALARFVRAEERAAR